MKLYVSYMTAVQKLHEKTTLKLYSVIYPIKAMQSCDLEASTGYFWTALEQICAYKLWLYLYMCPQIITAVTIVPYSTINIDIGAIRIRNNKWHAKLQPVFFE